MWYKIFTELQNLYHQHGFFAAAWLMVKYCADPRALGGATVALIGAFAPFPFVAKEPKSSGTAKFLGFEMSFEGGMRVALVMFGLAMLAFAYLGSSATIDSHGYKTKVAGPEDTPTQ